MRILVLGATGFLGRHAVESLRALPGARVLVGGRNPGAGPHLDLTADPAHLVTAVREAAPHAVVNCAGAVGGSATTLIGVNAKGPAVLCDALSEAAPGARLVHLGSAAEYGAADGERPAAETGPARPLGLYGVAKLAGTLAVTGSGLDAVVLRVFNPVGPGAPRGSLPGRLAAELRAAGPGGRVRVGDLSAHRDFVDARDVGEAVARAVAAPGPLPPVLNIGSGTARPVRELARGLVAAAGFDGRLEEDGDGSPRSAAVPWQRADLALTARTLGWTPARPLAESLADLWAETLARPEERAR
ncbi:NarL family transcriptional regulator [Streptomyces eurocidicus]|uniref:NarL family transcriptional regulator n=1 Tax=Streptomyces eurocidicus TaxID=66423 RepID=A0A2N8NQ29_STREU|nr:NAD-dependent epimerase/dehydratase family protein [Streptomyces eurocidicus]MBB5122347.1 nucleoside-diphosphate-sugar epimerase [Streptomyces eurocidicus]MBF6051631.1 NAD-dependent epimerase/dehydratase family protein [Streptomyces eurocidicus]PNE30875.1 NarL family transcriptional regulator [Streptomyces eurocidicus]